MSSKHLLLGLLTVAVWGFNFPLITIGLQGGVPPLLLCAIRFFLVAFPGVFFFPRPKTSWKLLGGYGLTTFGLQFCFLFTGMHLGMTAGLAALVLQIQGFFTIGLAAFLFKDIPGLWKIIGALISVCGIAIVGYFTSGSATFIGLVLTLLAAFSWSSGNIFSKKIATESPLSLVVWGALVAFPVLMALSLLVEGPTAIGRSLSHISWKAAAAIAYIVYCSTHLAYSLWGLLLNKYPTATIAPFTVLVPIFGMLGSVLILNEEMQPWKFAAAALVIGGLCLNLLEPQIKGLFRK